METYFPYNLFDIIISEVSEVFVYVFVSEPGLIIHIDVPYN